MDLTVVRQKEICKLHKYERTLCVYTQLAASVIYAEKKSVKALED